MPSQEGSPTSAGALGWTSWSAEEVARWVAEVLHLPQYAEAFLSADVDGPTLSELTEDILKDELQVNSTLHRKKIVAHCKLLRGIPLGQTGESNASVGTPEELDHPRSEEGISASTASVAQGAHQQTLGLTGSQTLPSPLPTMHSNLHPGPVGTPRSSREGSKESQSTISAGARGPLAIYHGMSHCARRAHERSTVDWAAYEVLAGQTTPVHSSSLTLETTLEYQPPPRVAGAPPPTVGKAPRLSTGSIKNSPLASQRRTASHSPTAVGTGSTTISIHSPQDLQRHNGTLPQWSSNLLKPPAQTLRRSASCQVTPVGTSSTIGCIRPVSTSSSIGSDSVRGRPCIGTNSILSSEKFSPRATIGKSCRNDIPWYGKMAWQPRPTEASPGAGAYNPHVHSSFMSKPAPGSVIGNAPRFAKSGDLNAAYPKWLRSPR